MGWIVDRLTAIGAPFDDPQAQLDVHRALFRAEAPKLLGPRGRLYVAHVDGALAGVGALKPVDDDVADQADVRAAPPSGPRDRTPDSAMVAR